MATEKTQFNSSGDDTSVAVHNVHAASSIVVVCEHASAFIPEQFGTLGLDAPALKSHVAWDPGALAVSSQLAGTLDAALVTSQVSRLVYDCNRPPDAEDAMPERSEIYDILGNQGLSDADKARRTAAYYTPFHTAVTDALARAQDAVLVTMHSFTPVYHGTTRDVEIGVLHDSDARLADALLAVASDHTTHLVRRNDPYGAEHGVTHTLREHAVPFGRLNVMIEVRNDLIQTEAAQRKMADMIAGWLADALTMIGARACLA